MGANMTSRLLRGGHAVVATDLQEEAVRSAEAEGPRVRAPWRNWSSVWRRHAPYG